jgi:PPOX class probable F420-dependent enzyme
VNEADMQRLAREARIARLATVDPDGRPNVVPVVFVLEGDTFYSSVDAKPKRTHRLRRLQNIERDPRAVAVIIDHYEEDWPALWWIRLRGAGRVLEEGPERQRALGLLEAKYEQYRDMPPQGSVLAIDVEEWRGWSWGPVE